MKPYETQITETYRYGVLDHTTRYDYYQIDENLVRSNNGELFTFMGDGTVYRWSDGCYTTKESS